jgi:hypothetical protein
MMGFCCKLWKSFSKRLGKALKENSHYYHAPKLLPRRVTKDLFPQRRQIDWIPRAMIPSWSCVFCGGAFDLGVQAATTYPELLPNTSLKWQVSCCSLQ